MTASAVLGALAEIDKKVVWPRIFPQPYLDELSALQALTDDPAISEETHAQIHWETVNLTRPLLLTGQELFSEAMHICGSGAILLRQPIDSSLPRLVEHKFDLFPRCIP